MTQSLPAMIRADIEATTHANFRLHSNARFWTRALAKALLSPNVRAVITFRLAHHLAKHKLLPLAMWLRGRAVSRSGADIHPLAPVKDLPLSRRQMVEIAKALARKPRILILDEPTSNVDVRTEGRIELGLRRLLAGRTAIVIAHRLSTIRNSGRILVLADGGIVEQGTHDELIEAGGAYAKLYRDWAEQAA